MTWAGTFVVGRGYAAYIGVPGDNAAHQHAAIQLTFTKGELIEARDEQGRCTRAQKLFIPPLTQHALLAESDLVSLYIEPQTHLGRLLLEQSGADSISAPVEFECLELDDCNTESLLTQLDALTAKPSIELDARLLEAMRLLDQADSNLKISQVAKLCEMSVSRLRMLANRDLGLPLATWLIWRKLTRAVKALTEKATLTEAAHVGGFSDQAHLCRVTKRMFGITPKTAASGLKWQTRGAANAQ